MPLRPREWPLMGFRVIGNRLFALLFGVAESRFRGFRIAQVRGGRLDALPHHAFSAMSDDPLLMESHEGSLHLL
jgi:hypothetical protein